MPFHPHVSPTLQRLVEDAVQFASGGWQSQGLPYSVSVSLWLDDPAAPMLEAYVDSPHPCDALLAQRPQGLRNAHIRQHSNSVSVAVPIFSHVHRSGTAASLSAMCLRVCVLLSLRGAVNVTIMSRGAVNSVLARFCCNELNLPGRFNTRVTLTRMTSAITLLVTTHQGHSPFDPSEVVVVAPDHLSASSHLSQAFNAAWKRATTGARRVWLLGVALTSVSADEMDTCEWASKSTRETVMLRRGHEAATLLAAQLSEQPQHVTDSHCAAIVHAVRLFMTTSSRLATTSRNVETTPAPRTRVPGEQHHVVAVPGNMTEFPIVVKIAAPEARPTTVDVTRMMTKLGAIGVPFCRAVTRDLLSSSRLLCQWQRRFLLCLAADAAHPQQIQLIVADQHAISERLRLERFMTSPSVQASFLVSETLPQPIPIPAHMHQDVNRFSEALHVNCFKVDRQLASDAPGDTLSLVAVPCVVVEGVRKSLEGPLAVLASFLRELQHSGGLKETMMPEVIEALVERSCRGAIMFGDHLTHRDAQNLIAAVTREAQRFDVCSHGRTSVAVIHTLATNTLSQQSPFFNPYTA